MINIHRYIENTCVEGPGKRFAIWLQGCSRRCKGCYAVDTWSHDPQMLYDVNEFADMVNSIEAIEGITILGGEPFEQAEELLNLIHLIRSELSIILFTGFKLKDLEAMNDRCINEILDSIDVLVDGKYDEQVKDLSRPMVGSSNQEFIFLTDRYQYEDFPKNDIEIRVNKNGTVLINGNGRIESIVV